MVPVGDDGHNPVGELALEEFEQRTHLAGTGDFETGPPAGRQGLGRDLALLNGRVTDRAVADVSAAPRQPVLVVTDFFQMLTPDAGPIGL